MTAHQADDLAETLLWRLFRGEGQIQGEGILLRYSGQMRPFLETRKKDLVRFLEEEGVEWGEDLTNEDRRFMRAGLRQELMPVIERHFPRAIDHLVAAARRSRHGVSDSDAFFSNLNKREN